MRISDWSSDVCSSDLPTDIRNPDTFHKVVDCQWACPAHTPVPEYIRLIAAGRHADAYMVNWHSNVFPGILGRTCDRPCEPACRRGRVEENNGPESMREKPEPVAICRLKRVAADHKGDVRARMRSEEHTSELQSLMRISYAVFCLKKKKHKNQQKYRTKQCE